MNRSTPLSTLGFTDNFRPLVNEVQYIPTAAVGARPLVSSPCLLKAGEQVCWYDREMGEHDGLSVYGMPKGFPTPRRIHLLAFKNANSAIAARCEFVVPSSKRVLAC